MQAIPRLKHLANLTSPGATQLASFHSTPISHDKWKKNWDTGSNKGQNQQPSKSYIKYVTRQRRAAAKRTLKNLLFGDLPFGSSSPHVNGAKRVKDKRSGFDFNSEDDTDSSTQAGRSNTSHSKKAKLKQRRKQRKGYATEHDEQQETIFRAKFGNRWYTWSFNTFHSSFYRSTFGFDEKENTQNKDDRQKWWEAESEADSDNERGQVLGSHSDRTVLGLPPYGPLKIEDVKSAFRTSALKWHPDKHYVTWTRVRGSDTDKDPKVRYVIPKNLGHGDTVRDLDTGTGTRQ